MPVLALILISVGIFFLIASLKPARTICDQDNHHGWKLLLGLILLFLFAYVFFLFYFLSHQSMGLIEHSIAFILAAGALFVKMVIELCLRSIKRTQKIANQEKHNALHDSLTGIANRKYFIKRLNQKVKISVPFSLFIIDIHRFKQINEMLGHYFADQLLIQVAENIKLQLNKRCFLARIGGDQFTLISNAVTDEEISQLMKRIHDATKLPFNFNEHHLKIEVSCGGTLFPVHGERVSVLLQQADIAMRSAKTLHNDYVIYNESLGNDANLRLKIAGKLSSALENNELAVYYQPMFKKDAKSCHHLEALIRWPQKEGGFIAPDLFIPIAEQNNQIRKVTLFVLDEICKSLRILRQKNLTACIHINLSARDLQDNYFSEALAKLVEQGELVPDELILEVTETAIMKDLSNAKMVLQALSEQGFIVSLDDFGTGYSSLSMLLELPIDQIKVDRSFVMSMQEEEVGYQIVKSIIFMAHNLNCTVVAEGVETQEMVDELTALQCDYLQGYFYSKPLPLNSLLTYCEESKH